MAQVTIYLDDDLLEQVRSNTKSAGISQSQWITEAVRLRLRREWPASVRELAGAWPDFPEAHEIRAEFGEDIKREKL